MNFKEYKAKRDALLDKAEKLITEGKVDEALQAKKEVEELDAQFQKEKDAQSDIEAMRNQGAPSHIVDMTGEPIMNQGSNVRVYNAASKEYKIAFLKNLKGLQLSDAEGEAYRQVNAAFIQTTGNTSAVIPTEMLNEIWDLVSGEHPIVGDVNRIMSGCAIEIPVHTAIAQGAGKIVGEGTANDDLKNTVTKVTLSGKDFSANIDLSYATAQMAIDALEDYLTTEISNTIGAAMADHIVSVVESGVNTANQITTTNTGKMVYKDITAAFAQLKRCAGITAYMNRLTLYTYVANIEDTAGHLIFVPNANEAADGNLLGGLVKIEDSVKDGEILVGDPKRIPFNVIQDIMLETDRDIKNHVITYAGYARGEAKVADDKCFATLNVKTA